MTTPETHRHRQSTAPEPKPRRLIFHADDLGFTFGFTDAIHRAHKHGNVTSTCIQVAGAAYDYARQEILPDCPDLGLGVHLNLVECRPRLAPHIIPDLVDADGCFRGYRPLLRAAASRRLRSQALDECRAQIEKALDDGLRIDHLNSHRHTHMLPWLFDGVCELADRFGIPFVRMASERFHLPRPIRSGRYLGRDANWAKQGLMNLFAARNRRRLGRIRCNDRFVGLSFTGHGSVESIQSALRANDAPLVEVLLHPSIRHHPRDRHGLPESVQRYCNAPARDAEMSAALSTTLRNQIERMGYELTNYRRLAAPTEGRQAPRAGLPTRARPLIAPVESTRREPQSQEQPAH